MRLSEALEIVCHRRDDPTARELVREAGSVVFDALSKRSGGGGRGAPRDVDDVVSNVFLKVLGADVAATVRASHPQADPDEVDRRCLAYLRQMVRNAAVDAARAESRRALETSKAAAAEMVEAHLPLDEELGRDLENLLAAVAKEAVESRASRYRDALRIALAQVIALATGESTMDALLAAGGITSSMPETDRVRVRNALYTAHKRARFALLGAADQLVARGDLDEDGLERVRRVVAQHLCRCQRTRR